MHKFNFQFMHKFKCTTQKLEHFFWYSLIHIYDTPEVKYIKICPSLYYINAIVFQMKIARLKKISINRLFDTIVYVS